MSKSLQDQLLALGLASQKSGKPSRRAPGRAHRQEGARISPVKGPDREKPASDDELSLDRAYALRNKEENKQTDAARKRKQAEDRRRRRLNREIKTIVSKHRLNDSTADVPRHFMYRGRIRKINLAPDQLNALNAGELGIAYLSGGYHLLAPEHVELVRRLSAEHIPDLAPGEVKEENDYPIPDDLSW